MKHLGFVGKSTEYLGYSLTEQNKVLKSNSKTVFIDLIFNFGTICI